MDASARRVSEIMQAEVATLTVHDRLDLAEGVMRLGDVRDAARLLIEEVRDGYRRIRKAL